MDEPTAEPVIEPWPDPEDITTWLQSLDEGVRLLEEQLVRAKDHRAACRVAVDVAPTSEDARKHLCLLMHGVELQPEELTPDALGPEDAALLEKMWTPPTDEQKRERARAELAKQRERDAAEQKRRIALAEKITGVPYEGLHIDDLVPSVRARRAIALGANPQLIRDEQLLDERRAMLPKDP